MWKAGEKAVEDSTPSRHTGAQKFAGSGGKGACVCNSVAAATDDPSEADDGGVGRPKLPRAGKADGE